MTDRELLEAAAKAAGMELTQWSDSEDAYLTMSFDARGWWNPLEDDGDALRLLVKLREDLCLDAAAMLGCGNFASWEADPYAATRRAIVRAAAVIATAKQD